METIARLLQQYQEIWVFVGPNQEDRQQFAQKGCAQGWGIIGGRALEPDSVGNCMSIHLEKGLLHVPLMAWQASFSREAARMFITRSIKGLLRVDYAVLRTGSPNFVYLSTGKLGSLADFEAEVKSQRADEAQMKQTLTSKLASLKDKPLT